MDNVSAYWDPLPTVRRMMRPPAPASRPFAGLRDYVAYIDGELGRHLRGYLCWLDQRREPRPGEALPHL